MHTWVCTRIQLRLDFFMFSIMRINICGATTNSKECKWNYQSNTAGVGSEFGLLPSQYWVCTPSVLSSVPQLLCTEYNANTSRWNVAPLVHKHLAELLDAFWLWNTLPDFADPENPTVDQGARCLARQDRDIFCVQQGSTDLRWDVSL